MKSSRVFLFALLTMSCPPLMARELPALADVVTSEDNVTESGKWNYIQRRSLQPWSCNDSASSPMCTEHVVVLNNQSGQTLECSLNIDFKRADGSIDSSFAGPALVLPRTSVDVHSLTTDAGTRAEIRRLSCFARTPYKRVAKVPGCKYEMMGKPFESYYPEQARQLALQGPVIVAFMLDRREGAAKEISVVESSLTPALDEAARRFIRDQTFLTNCPDTRFDMLMRFKLRS